MAARDVILIGALVFMFAIGFFSSFYALNEGFDAMLENEVINSSSQTFSSLQAAQDLTGRFDYIIFAIFIAMILGLIISGWFVGGHPIFMFAYFLLVLVGVILTAVFSNAWDTISTLSVFGTTIASFTITNNLLSYLPIYISVAGFLGLVVMFAKPYIAENQ